MGLNIVLDCANGAGYQAFPKLIRELGGKVWVTGNEPNGLNINDGCGAVNPERLQQMVRDRKADIGIALDGDADRAMFVCEQGKVVNGDHALAAFALDLKQQGRLKNDTVVGTVMSNFGFDVCMRQAGINLVRTAVGDRYILERMVAGPYNLGGEQSGHMIFLDYHTSGDGLIAGVQMLKVMKRTGKPLSELAGAMTVFPQVLLGVKVPYKPDLNSLQRLQEAIKASERRLDGMGRVLVRYSGTEPLLRVMVEGSNSETIKEIAENLIKIIKEEVQ